MKVAEYTDALGRTWDIHHTRDPFSGDESWGASPVDDPEGRGVVVGIGEAMSRAQVERAIDTEAKNEDPSHD